MSKVEECPLIIDHRSEFEVFVDSLVSEIGLIYADALKSEQTELKFISEMLYHLSMVLRAEYPLSEQETEELKFLGSKYNYLIPKALILPISKDKTACQCHVVRSHCLQAVAMLRRYEVATDNVVDQRVFDVFNSLAQYFFGMAIVKSQDDAIFFESRVKH